MELISSIGMTFAPASRAIVEVESVDESSITISSSIKPLISIFLFYEETISPIVDASFLQGTQTEIF